MYTGIHCTTDQWSERIIHRSRYERNGTGGGKAEQGTQTEPKEDADGPQQPPPRAQRYHLAGCRKRPAFARSAVGSVLATTLTR